MRVKTQHSHTNTGKKSQWKKNSRKNQNRPKKNPKKGNEKRSRCAYVELPNKPPATAKNRSVHFVSFRFGISANISWSAAENETRRRWKKSWPAKRSKPKRQIPWVL